SRISRRVPCVWRNSVSHHWSAELRWAGHYTRHCDRTLRSLPNTDRMPQLSLRPVTPDDAERLFHLMQFYYFEASAWSGEDVRADGLFDCELSDVLASIRADPQWGRLLFVDDVLAGFVLVDQVEHDGRHCPELADLFVLPRHRRKGL